MKGYKHVTVFKNTSMNFLFNDLKHKGLVFISIFAIH